MKRQRKEDVVTPAMALTAFMIALGTRKEEMR
jgi:hypothetical protein